MVYTKLKEKQYLGRITTSMRQEKKKNPFPNLSNPSSRVGLWTNFQKRKNFRSSLASGPYKLNSRGLCQYMPRSPCWHGPNRSTAHPVRDREVILWAEDVGHQKFVCTTSFPPPHKCQEESMYVCYPRE